MYHLEECPMFSWFRTFLCSELDIRFLHELMSELSLFFPRFYSFHKESNRNSFDCFFLQNKNQSNSLVLVDIEQVTFVNVINIDHLQIDQSFKTTQDFIKQITNIHYIHKIVQLLYRQNIHRIRMV